MSKTKLWGCFWFLWEHNNAGGGKTKVEDVCYRKHPFEVMKEREEAARENGSGYHKSGIVLLNWKPITSAEYALFIKQ